MFCCRLLLKRFYDQNSKMQVIFYRTKVFIQYFWLTFNLCQNSSLSRSSPKANNFLLVIFQLIKLFLNLTHIIVIVSTSK